MPELVQDYPDTYANMGIHDLGDKMFAWLRENNPGARLNAAYSTLPVAEITPRDAYNAIVNNNIEMVAIENLPGRIAANPLFLTRQASRCCSPAKTLAMKTVRRWVTYAHCNPGIITSWL